MSDALFFLTPTAFQEIEDMVFEQLAGIEDDLVNALIDSKNLTYGDIDLPPVEAILKFMDDEARGVNAWIAQNEPDEHARRVTEFNRDVERSGII